MLTSRLSRVLLALSLVSVAALAQVRTKGAVVGEAVKSLPTLTPPPPATAAPNTQAGLTRPASPPVATLGYEVITGPIVTVPPDTQYDQLLQCPAGKKVVGGGVNSGSFFSRMISSYPAGQVAWSVKGRNDLKTGTAQIQAYAICVIAF